MDRGKPEEGWAAGGISCLPLDSRHYGKTANVLAYTALLSLQDDFEEVLRLIAEEGMALFEASAFSVVMLNPTTQETAKTLVRTGKEFTDREGRLLRINVTGWVTSRRESFLTEALQADPRFAPGLFSSLNVGSVICAPVPNARHACGFLLGTRQSGQPCFERQDLVFLEQCAAVWGGFLNNAPKVQGFFDPLMPDDVLLRKYTALGLLGRSSRFKKLLRAVEAASNCEVRVFLEGESGTGKERIARAIHRLGRRSNEPFVAVDCGAIPPALAESELFGHVRGAFTGAHQARKGLLEEADGGTLFMDEIENLSLDVQAKLLRVLQDGEVRAVGSDKARKVDVRIIAASTRPALKLMKDKLLREDLFYRLHVYPVQVPTLNERLEDIPLLAEHFLELYGAGQNKPVEAFHPDVLRFLQHRSWPGNVRELENFVERLVALAPAGERILQAGVLPEEYRSEFRAVSLAPASCDETPGGGAAESLDEKLDAYERQILIETLQRYHWNQSHAARALSISERAMRYKMERLRIDRPEP